MKIENIMRNDLTSAVIVDRREAMLSVKETNNINQIKYLPDR